MKKYTIICKSLTAKNGHIMQEGETFGEEYFAHIDEHLKNGHIAEAKPEPEVKAEVETEKPAKVEKPAKGDKA